MAAISRMLVPVDLSPLSLEAAAWGASLARAFGAELVLLHALPGGWPLGEKQREIRDDLQRSAGAHRLLFREGPVVPAILAAAEAERSDLILIATRGKPALARFFDGSIGAQVLRGAACPVWVGPADLLPFSSRPIRTILCGLSLGPGASRVLRWSAALAQRLNATLSLVHTGPELRPGHGGRCEHEWRHWLEKAASDNIVELQSRIGTEADVWLESGSPLDAIPPVADLLRADLLVVGKSPRKKLFGDLRTLSYEIALRVRRPVASV